MPTSYRVVERDDDMYGYEFEAQCKQVKLFGRFRDKLGNRSLQACF